MHAGLEATIITEKKSSSCPTLVIISITLAWTRIFYLEVRQSWNFTPRNSRLTVIFYQLVGGTGHQAFMLQGSSISLTNKRVLQFTQRRSGLKLSLFDTENWTSERNFHRQGPPLNFRSPISYLRLCSVRRQDGTISDECSKRSSHASYFIQ